MTEPPKTRDKRVKRAAIRRSSRRVQASNRNAADSRDRLEARIALEQAQAAREAAQREAEHETQDSPAADRLRQAVATFAREERNEQLRAQWPLGEARNLVRDGYSVAHTTERTGWPARMLSDVAPDRW